MKSFARPALLAAMIVLAACSPSPQADKPPRALADGELALIRSKMGALASPVTITWWEGGTGEEERKREIRRGETALLLKAMQAASPLLTVRRLRVTEAALKEISLPVPGSAHGPRLRVEASSGRGFLYLGYPAEKELSPFLDGVLAVSGQAPPLAATTGRFLDGLSRDIRLEIFVTPH